MNQSVVADASLLSHYPTGIYRLRLSGEDSCCGCPLCCLGTTLTCDTHSYSLPWELREIYTQKEWGEFRGKLDGALRDYYWPPCPCALTLCCLPCLFCIVLSSCDRRRNQHLQRIINEESNRLIPKGLEWVRPAYGHHSNYPRLLDRNTLAVLRWNRGYRESYEAAHPDERKVSEEPLRDEFKFVHAHAAAAVYPNSMMIMQHQSGGHGAAAISMQPIFAPVVYGGPSSSAALSASLSAAEGPPLLQRMDGDVARAPIVATPLPPPPSYDQRAEGVPPPPAPPPAASVASSSSPSTRFCTQCGSQTIVGHAKFCSEVSGGRATTQQQ